MTASNHDSSAPLLLGRYRLLELAGRGGMGEVHRAWDEQLGEVVAVKLLRGEAGPGAVARFVREAQVLASLSHRRIVRHLAHGEVEDGRVFIAMEWVPGLDLATRLERQPPLMVQEVVTLGARTAGALGAAHRRGIVHRDVKPRNIRLRDGDPTLPVLLDFGIARLGEGGGTLTGHVIGTPRYMAPEQLRGERGITPRADVFALGAVLWEALAGAHPFDSAHGASSGGGGRFDEPRSVRELRPDVPPTLDALLTRMLARDPAARPADGQIVAALLEAVAASGPGASPQRPTITGGEQQLTCAVAVRLAPCSDTTATSAPSTVPPWAPLASLAAELGARTEVMADGAVLAVLPPRPDVAETAAGAATLARRMLGAAPVAGAAICTGWCQIGDRAAAGDLPGLAMELLRSARPGAPLLDDETALLLDGRFSLARGPLGLELGPPRTPSTTRALAGRYSPFVGRAAELALLEGAWQTCLDDGAPSVVLVEGEPGVGKTRLLQSFAGSLDRRPDPPTVMWATAAPGADPFTLLDGLTAGRRGSERLRAILSTTLSAPAEPRDALCAIRDALLEWLRLVPTPALIVLDDTQWAGAASLRLMGDLLDEPVGPILVVALARGGSAGDEGALCRDRSSTRLVLGRLSRRAASTLVRAGVGTDARDDEVERLVEAGDGNPLFLEELVRVRQIAADPSATLPPSLAAAAQARLGSVSPPERRILRAASVQEEPFSAADVASVAGGDGDASVEAWLCSLVDAELLVRRADGWAFRHAVLRDAAHRSLLPADRRFAHGIVADRLAAAEAPPSRVAPHLELAGRRALAGRCWLSAAARALSKADLDGCADAARRAAASSVDPVDRGEAKALQATAARWLGDIGRALRLAQEAVALLPEGHPAWFGAIAEIVDGQAELGAPNDATGWLDSLARVAQRTQDGATQVPVPAAIALCRAVVGLVFGGAYTLADGVLRLVEPLAGSADALVRARWERALGFREAAETRHADSERRFGAAADAFEAAGHSHSATIERIHVAWCHLEQGRLADAIASLEGHATAAEAARTPPTATYARLYLGRALALAGELDASISMLRSVIAFNDGIGNVLEREGARIFLALALVSAGDGEAALAQAQQAVDALRGLPALQAFARAALIDARVAVGHPAGDVAEAAAAQLLALGTLPHGDAALRRALAEAARAAGDGERAAAALRDAVARIEGRAALLPTHRVEAFLRSGPDVARTLSLAAAWGLPGLDAGRSPA